MSDLQESIARLDDWAKWLEGDPNGEDCKLAADLRTVIAALSWQPLDTAPRDREVLFLIVPKTAEELGAIWGKTRFAPWTNPPHVQRRWG